MMDSRNDLLKRDWYITWKFVSLFLVIGLIFFIISDDNRDVKNSVILATYAREKHYHIEVAAVDIHNPSTVHSNNKYHCNATVPSLGSYTVGERLAILYDSPTDCEVYRGVSLRDGYIAGLVLLVVGSAACFITSLVIYLIYKNYCCKYAYLPNEEKQEPVRQYEVFYNGER